MVLTIGKELHLLPGPEGLDADLLEVVVGEGGEGVKVDLVAEEEVGVLGQALLGEHAREVVTARYLRQKETNGIKSTFLVHDNYDT